MASTINGVTTRFVGEYYEVTENVITKYYGGKTAMRKNSEVTYLLADHLSLRWRSGMLRFTPRGSNSVITSDTGTFLSETRYKPCPTRCALGCYAALREGEIRYSTGTATTTPYTYIMIPEAQRSGTGQYSDTADFGWMYYKARWYDPELGRFGQADSIVPGAGDPRAWDRYSYVKNNPARYNDPSGHCIDPDACVPKPPTNVNQIPPLPPKNSGLLDSDEFGRAILGRYLTGKGDWNILYDPKWSDYMTNNTTLKEDLNQRANENAQFMFNNGYSKISIDDRYAMEIENGESIIGYQYLHGTNATIGGFQRLGSATMEKNSDEGYKVTFSMSYTWNDMIDPNPKYATDKIKSTFAEIITFGKATPYNIHIFWTQNIVILLNSKGNVIQ